MNSSFIIPQLYQSYSCPEPGMDLTHHQYLSEVIHMAREYKTEIESYITNVEEINQNLQKLQEQCHQELWYNLSIACLLYKRWLINQAQDLTKMMYTVWTKTKSIYCTFVQDDMKICTGMESLADLETLGTDDLIEIHKDLSH
ncbi:unnamed protein product, partial [Meganyctiphanes norvegica]